MAKQKSTGLLVNGSVKAAGMTFYTRQGQTVVRAARSAQPERRSRGQFDQRMRMRHTIALWHIVKVASPYFGEGVTAYRRFASLANRLAPVYVPCTGSLSGATFLLPGIPVSDGPLPTIKMWYDEVGGQPALLTNLKPENCAPRETLRLCCLRQSADGAAPRVDMHWRLMEMPTGTDHFGADELHLVLVDGRVALVGAALADPMTGWALVLTDGDRCSSQTVVTRCTFYERYTTAEALETAAASYGGLTE